MFVAKGKDGENIGKENLTFSTIHNSMQRKKYGKDGRDVKHASKGKQIQVQ
jgi:hypothetical protein